MSYKTDAYKITAEKIIEKLKKRNIEGYFCEKSADVVELILSIMEEGSAISWGGSETIKECGLMDAVQNKGYTLIDRSTAKTPEEAREIFGKTVMSDYYFMSTNAITLDGELVNIDGNGNRLACLIHGPKNVIIVAGMNKVAKDIPSAYSRIKTHACPPNALRLNRKMPCAVTGVCGECYSDECFCNQIVVTRRSGHKGRIKVVLVGEELGY